MQYRFVRTAAGQAEIQSRALNLSRPVRNLLLILNASQTGDYWLSQVKGCTEDDIAHLVAEGLIEPVAAPAPAPPRAVVAANNEASEYQALQQQIRQADYATLYEALNAFSKQALGLVRGYRFALEIEKCSGPQELQALALRFIERVRAEQGPEPLKRFGQMLAPH
jgi:hypothetical protein